MVNFSTFFLFYHIISSGIKFSSIFFYWVVPYHINHNVYILECGRCLGKIRKPVFKINPRPNLWKIGPSNNKMILPYCGVNHDLFLKKYFFLQLKNIMIPKKNIMIRKKNIFSIITIRTWICSFFVFLFFQSHTHRIGSSTILNVFKCDRAA
jgi:hypothetical protein